MFFLILAFSVLGKTEKATAATWGFMLSEVYSDHVGAGAGTLSLKASSRVQIVRGGTSLRLVIGNSLF